MSEPPNLRTARVEVAFFGTVTASLSHELKNVLATIGELNGLLFDLGLAASPSRPFDPARAKTICDKVSKQVTRGENLISRMNRFAHSADEPVGSIDLTELVRDIVELSRRFAYLKQVTLELALPKESLPVKLDPFTGMYAVFLGIQLALSTAAEERRVAVSLEADESGAKVFVESADPFNIDCTPQSELQLLESVAARLNGQILWTHEGGRDRLCLSLGQ
jgi:signal transduction histidine kinase